MPQRYICIHGHFYQPPRENAWLERVEIQDSAAPYHDWNERIAAECYGPNAASRILNDDKKIVGIVNNYEKISFNYGPTLLNWLELNKPEIYAAILDADARSMVTQNGHGNAIAQVYNHIIMPLANRRDKETQIIWGIRDFVRRFGREPEGMWLAETAVDTETLELLVAHGIKYTILAPRQVKRWRSIGAQHWHEEGCDARRAYKCMLPDKKSSIDIFVYDGDLSQMLAFEDLLTDGKIFANALSGKFTDDYKPQLEHVALDGETFGHHHKHGDMALAFCLRQIEEKSLAKIVNYGHFLELYPPQYEIELHENSSWSCVHGVERWRADCGCHTGGEPGWNQQWRAPLRKALDYLREEFTRIYEIEMAPLAKDIWTMRNAYIDVISDRSDASVDAFVKKHADKPLNAISKTRFLRLLEMQRHQLLMYTSCGWFFNDVSGIETQQILQYACRGIQLGEQMGNYPMRDRFLSILKEAKSNIPSFKNGARIYVDYIQNATLTLSKVGLHYAVHSLFEDTPEFFDILNYRAESHNYERFDEGENKLAVGQTTVHSLITHSTKNFSFALLYLGQHHIIGSYSDMLDEKVYQQMRDEIKNHFEDSNIALVTQTMESYFGPEKFSFWQLFKDEQLRVLDGIINTHRTNTENSNQRSYQNNYPILSVLHKHNLPIPATFRKNLEMVLNSELRRVFENGSIKTPALKNLTDEILKWEVEVNVADVAFAAERKLLIMVQAFAEQPDLVQLERIHFTLDCLNRLDVTLNLWEVQNILFNWAHTQSAHVWREQPDKVLETEFHRLAQRIELSL